LKISILNNNNNKTILNEERIILEILNV
jgi:hypothetical protein